MKEGISFVTAADDGFHQGLSALLKSFCISNQRLAPLRLIVMDCGLTPESVHALEHELAQYGTAQKLPLSLEFIKADLSRWEPFPPHWDSYAAYAFLEAVKEVNTRYLVFADADMLHFKDLSHTIDELEASGKKLAGVVDPDYSTLKDDFYVNHLSPLSPAEQELPYLNSGYLIFDLNRFLHTDLDQFIKQLTPSKAHERFKGVKKFKHDQTLLNTFIKGDCLVLDDSYNYFCKENQRFIGLTGRKNFHFISNPKPWDEGTHETLAREVAFRTTEAAFTESQHPSLPLKMKGPSLTDRLKSLFYTLLGKQKKLHRLRASRISLSQLNTLQQTILSWCQK